MKELVEIIVTALVDHPESVIVTEHTSGDEQEIDVQVAQEDMGKVIGKQGRIAHALRTVVKAAAIKQDIKVSVEIMSDKEAAEKESSMASEAKESSEVSETSEAAQEEDAADASRDPQEDSAT